uniref:NR LBD domain-containing protein n=1 Tax=Macrostomum lignano TaxID=282301 RepID=A0A1I8F4F9_9PLAT
AFLGGTADQFPRRSQSVSAPARRGSAVLPSATLQPFATALGCQPPSSSAAPCRPLSAPRGLRGPRAWPRILQLYMLEHNFQFAVSPAATSASQESGEVATTAKWQPTKSFADDLQRLIAAASNLPFDTVTYNLLRLAAIFMPDQSQPDAPALAEVQSEIMKHIYHHLGVKGLAQHFKEAEAILEAVSQTDKARLEILFCSHLSSTVDEYIRVQLG